MKKLLLILLSALSLTAYAEDAIKKVAILPTVDKEGDVNYGIEFQLRASLTYAINMTSGYKGVDRVDISSIMSEQNFQRTGNVDDKQIKELGRMTGAQYVLIAEAALFDEQNIIIAAKILDVETSDLIKSTPPVISGKTPEDMQAACIKVAKTLLGESLSTNAYSNRTANNTSISPQHTINHSVIEDKPTIDKDEEEEVFVVVESMPEFPCGQDSLFRYLSANVKYPVIAQENSIQGKVICQFVVNKDGSITDVEIIRSAGDPSLDEEAVRVVRSMPKWKPGKQRGKPVRVKYTIPIKFSLK